MPFVDVTKPIIVQASKVLTANIDNYLRRMCIVSDGGSTLPVGTSKIVRNSDFSEILNGIANQNSNGEALQKKLNGFFAYAGDKECCVLEVGAFNATSNTIAQQVSRLRDFVEGQVNRSYCHLVPDAWYYPSKSIVVTPNTTLSVTPALTALRPAVPDGETLPADVSAPVSQVTLTIITNAPDHHIEVADPSIVHYDSTTNTFIALQEGTTTATITANINSSNPNSKNAVVEVEFKVGVWNEDLALTPEETAKTSEQVSITTTNAPTEGERDLAFASFAGSYIDLEDKVFFFVNLKLLDDPSISEAWQLYKGKKSVFGVYDNLKDSPYPLASVVLGICASNRYDIGDTQVGTPLNYKALKGVSGTQLTHTFANNLIQAPATFAGSLAGNPTVLNGRYADGTAWEYYYFWDLIELEIKKKLEMLLLNGSNTSNSTIKYTQQGIDVLASSIKSELLLWQSRGLVTSFSQSYDQASNSQIGIGQIKAIDFYSYIKSNPEDYANEVYKGFSFYLMIGRFVRQIFIDVTLN